MRYVGTGAARGTDREAARLLRAGGHPVGGVPRLPADCAVTDPTLRPRREEVSA